MTLVDQPVPQSTPDRRLTMAKKLFFVGIALVLFLFVIEGFSTFFVAIYDAVFWSKSAGRDVSYTQYDPELGWVNKPDIYLEDLFGPGLSFKTNGQGFREDQDTSVQVPVGTVRFVCSGDSFTFGTGVDNGHTWVRQFAQQHDRVDSVNLGVGGYGVGQIYLRYLRSGKALDHDVHLFAFISHNFDRMRSDTFLGYGKPVLCVKEGALVAENVPVPKKMLLTAWLSQNPQIIGRFSTITLLSKVIQPVGPAGFSNTRTQAQMQQTVRAMIEDLLQINRDKGSTLVLVHIPTRTDYLSEFSSPLQQFLREASADIGVPYIDMIAELRKLSYEKMDSYFLKADQVLLSYAANHFTIEGNQYFAHELYEQLMQVPEVAAKLAN